MKAESCDTLSAFEESDEEYVYNDMEAALERVVSVNVEYDRERIPKGTVIVTDIASNETREVDADVFDTDLHSGERTVVSADVVENAEEIIIQLGLAWAHEEARILGHDHEFGRVDYAETVRDLLAAEKAYNPVSNN